MIFRLCTLLLFVAVSVMGADEEKNYQVQVDPNDARYIHFAIRKYYAEDQREDKTLDPNNPITKEGWKCVFPFEFEGEWYSGCMNNSYYFPWCATVKRFDWRNDHWGYCQNNTALTKPKPITTYSGKQCHFPFTYKEIEYYGCTTFDHPRHKSWCMIQDEEGKATTTKDLCRDELNADVDTFGGESHGEECQFPFVYNGKTYYGCTNDGEDNGQFWCITVLNKWGYCNTIDSETNLKRQRAQTGEIYQESSCVFPFVYDGETYHGCAGGDQWCSTTSNYDEDGYWKYCDDKDIIGVATRLSDYCSYPYLKDGVQWAEPLGEGNACATKYHLDSIGWSTTQFSAGVKYLCPMPWYQETTLHIGCKAGEFYYWCPKKNSHGGDDGEWWDCSYLNGLDVLPKLK